MAKIQAQGMGAQLQNVLSQTELNKATAKKTEAEAEKIAGADTKVAEREAEMLKSQSEFNRRYTMLVSQSRYKPYEYNSYLRK